MDYLSQQFAAAAKRLREELRTLNEHVLALRGLLQHAIDATDQQQKANAEREGTQQRRVLSELVTPAPIRIEAETYTRKDVWKTLLMGLEILVGLAVIAYTIIAHQTRMEMVRTTGAAERAVDEARRTRIQADKTFTATVEQFRLDQRAWVGIVSASPPDLKPKPTFFVSLQAVNSGRTPALNFQSVVVLRSLQKGTRFEPIYGAAPGPHSHRVIQPGESVTLNSPTYRITQGQIDWVRDGRYTLYVYGKMSYDDVFSRTHKTTFCKMILSESLVEDCETYNTAD